jgi:HD-GYP domain-containing protein (c-di-GMP phosphodiesterase class II)
VARVAVRLAEELGCDAKTLNTLYLAGLLHDIGKIGVSDAILHKPGKLTEEEFAVIQRHPDQGWSILQELHQLQYELPGVLYHHENFNGTGYPDRLAGERIPLPARIVAVADAFDAMTSDRPYRQGMPLTRVLEIFHDGNGTQWDPKVLEAFFDALPEILSLWTSYQPHATGRRRMPETVVQGEIPAPSSLAPAT